MSKKKKQAAEFRFYELPQDEPVLALMGSKWIQVYGENIDNQHFHNLLEIGYCHYGDGDLVLEDDTISRLHARICKEGEMVYLEDLNSTNGTFKNGLRLQPYEKRRLEEGDEVRFGKLLFVYR